MKILGIETSCDETAVCILDAEGEIESPIFNVSGNALYSQVKIHAQYGGVFPMLAKREHSKNIVPLLKKALEDAKMLKEHPGPKAGHPSLEKEGKLQEILHREPGLFELTKKFLEKYEKPDIDAIAVTSGPGLEPALWVGINFARALGEAWNVPVIPTNHMEGHIVSALMQHGNKLHFPALALLISGGHTELILMKNWSDFEVIGATRDDAIGEAFDKVARLLGLPYPGGPEISKYAAEARISPLFPKRGGESSSRGVQLPRPMITSDDYDFSFSGIKTAVLYLVRNLEKEHPEGLPQETKKQIALEFENAVTEVLIAKTKKALEEFGVETLILGGGVVANTFIRQQFQKLISEHFSEISLLIPEISLSTDNAVMIAMAAYINMKTGKKRESRLIKAEGNLKL